MRRQDQRKKSPGGWAWGQQRSAVHSANTGLGPKHTRHWAGAGAKQDPDRGASALLGLTCYGGRLSSNSTASPQSSFQVWPCPWLGAQRAQGCLAIVAGCELGWRQDLSSVTPRSWLGHREELAGPAGLINICGFSSGEGKFPKTPRLA